MSNSGSKRMAPLAVLAGVLVGSGWCPAQDETKPAGGAAEVEAREQRARTLAKAGKAAEAAEEYAWLWSNMLRLAPSRHGVRLTFTVKEMAQLAATSPAAKQKFMTLRDRAAKSIDGEKIDREALCDWVALNRVVGADVETLAWFDRVKARPSARRAIDAVAVELEPMLVARKRWADLGHLYADPLAQIEGARGLLAFSQSAERRDPERETAETRSFLRKQFAPLYAGLLAADRIADAALFAVRARELDGSPEMVAALVGSALEADQPSESHVEWLAAALAAKPAPTVERSLRNLSGRVQSAIAAKAKKKRKR